MPRPQLPLNSWGKITRLKANKKPAARASYRDSDGLVRTVLRTGKSFQIAEQNLLNALRERQAPSKADLNQNSTINDLASAWIKIPNTLSASSNRNYKRSIQNSISPALGNIKLHEATVPLLERFLSDESARRGASSAKTTRTTLNHLFLLALRHGAIKANPVTDTTPPLIASAPVTAYSIKDIHKVRGLLKTYDETLTKQGRARAFLIADIADMYIATGARAAEILPLKWADIDFNTSPASVEINKTIVEDEAGKLFIQNHPKTEAGFRRLYLPKSATDMLLRRRITSYTDLIFPSSTGTTIWPNNMRRVWSAALAGTEYSDLTTKAFRRAVATFLRDKKSIEAASNQLGHASTTVTSKHYTPLIHDAPDNADLLEEFFQNRK